MNKYHQEILEKIKRAGRSGTSETASYLGHPHLHYGISVPQRRVIAKEWTRVHKDISYIDFLALLDSLYNGKSYEEKTIASILLGYLPKLRKSIAPQDLDKWLDELVGWAEIDSLCQSNFTADDILSKWAEWEKLIRKFANNKNISKRRASLVLLTGVVSNFDDKRLANLAFEVVDKLKRERNILITKAISWLLRDLIKHSRTRVESYIKENSSSLAKIAIREVNAKLLK